MDACNHAIQTQPTRFISGHAQAGMADGRHRIDRKNAAIIDRVMIAGIKRDSLRFFVLCLGGFVVLVDDSAISALLIPL